MALLATTLLSVHVCTILTPRPPFFPTLQMSLLNPSTSSVRSGISSPSSFLPPVVGGIRWKRGTGGGEMEPEQNERILALEAEIYDFMEESSKPNCFPTKKELVAAMRMDLVEAIIDHGGWLVYGWDLDDSVDVEKGIEERRRQSLRGETRAEAIDSSQMRASSFTVGMVDNMTGRQGDGIPQKKREEDVGEDDGIEGILNRLEKERSLSYPEADDRSSRNKDYAAGNAASQAVRNLHWHGGNGLWGDVDTNEPVYPMADDMRNGSGEPQSSSVSDRRGILSDLQLLGSELASVLNSLGSRTNMIISRKGRQSSFEELNKLSDDLEFKETEIANVQDKVRSIKAKLSALEGKIALRSIEATKILGEKQKRIDAVQRVLGLLSTAYIVWSGSASEVFLAGSFDGWATQRRMEKSSTGIFTLYLKLYPGQYEIKFIVDGVWMVDTRRPIVHHSGFENNLLTVR